MAQIALLLSLLIWTTSGAAHAAEANESALLQPPTHDELEKAQATIREVYGDQITAARSPTLKAALARKLLDDAPAAADDQAGRYAILLLSSDLATQAAEIDAALDALDRLATDYQANVFELKATALTTAAKAAKLPSQAKPVLEAALTASSGAITEGDFASARQLLTVAGEAAKTARDLAQVRATAARVAELAELESQQAAATKAREELERSPADPSANLAVGRYLCLVQGDWTRGLPMLLLGSDAALKTAAKAELLQPKTAADQMKLADQWWLLAETSRGIMRERLEARAEKWYRAGLVGATGLARARVEKRLADMVPRTVVAPTARRNEVKGTLHATVDDRAEIYLNGTKLVEVRSKDTVTSAECTFKVGDLITVAATNREHERGLVCFFEAENRKSFFFTEPETWFEYTPHDTANWWDVRPSKTDTPAQSTNAHLLNPKIGVGHGPDIIWGQSPSTAYLYHVVSASDLAEPARAKTPAGAGVPGTLYATADDQADVRVNGQPIMRGLLSAVESAAITLRPGDVITVKGHSAASGYGAMVGFASKDGKARFGTNHDTWKSYAPARVGRWWEFKPSPNDARPSSGGASWLKIPELEGAKASNIWGADKHRMYLYHIVTAEDLSPPRR